jgi:transposase-like protein
MGQKQHYSESFREQALAKVYARGQRSVAAVAEELQLNQWTLKNWMKATRRSKPSPSSDANQRPQDWSRAQRLAVLMASHGLDEQALSALCRERGIFRHHLQQWQAEFEAVSERDERAALRGLKQHNTELARELKRKDKALAEAAALLVLQKKYQTLWADEDV